MEQGRLQIEGWLGLVDCLLLAALDNAQSQDGINGDLLEIGVFQGASAILLGYFVNPGERFVVCDLFGAPGLRPETDREALLFGISTRPVFEANYARFHATLPQVLAMPSSELAHRLPAGRFRIVHVDGSHAYADVRADIFLARQLLVPDGVVVLDDVSNPRVPGVGAAVWESVARDDLVPFAMGDKLYATWGSPPKLDPGLLAAELGRTLAEKSHQVAGHVLTHYEEVPNCEGAPKASSASRRLAAAWVPPAMKPLAVSFESHIRSASRGWWRRGE
ncbi:MAG: class I SAM-dependent methyltransferase [Acidimicrobiales bacterium]